MIINPRFIRARDAHGYCGMCRREFNTQIDCDPDRQARHPWARRHEYEDPETGLSHLWHAGCSLMVLITYEER